MRVNLPLLTVGELCPADNPLKMINDYPFEMSNFEMMLSLKWYMTVSSKWAKAPSILLRWSMTISPKSYFESKLPFARLRRVPGSCRLNSDQIQSARTRLKNSLLILSRWSMTIVSKWAAQFCIRFDMIYDCHFEMTAQKFSYRKSFSSITVSQILVTKMPPKPHIFVHRFFRSDCPLAAWKYKS